MALIRPRGIPGAGACLLLFVELGDPTGAAQSRSPEPTYEVVNVESGGSISGTVKWSGPIPTIPRLPITKDPKTCDPSFSAAWMVLQWNTRRWVQHLSVPGARFLGSNSMRYCPWELCSHRTIRFMLRAERAPMPSALRDMELGVKFGFIKQTKRRPQIGTFTMLEVPTGSYAKGLGIGKVCYKPPLWVEKDEGN
jgi:hypothetical protein